MKSGELSATGAEGKEGEYMAYVSQENKKSKMEDLKKIFKAYGLKATVAVKDHAVLCVNIKAGKLDFIQDRDNKLKEINETPLKRDYIDVNIYNLEKTHTGDCLNCLKDILQIANKGNHNRSDSQSDYFDVGWYVDINIGKYNSPYTLVV